MLIGLVRILTHPRVFRPPDTHAQAFAFVRSLVGHPNALLLNPGRDHLGLFEDLCGRADARGDLVTDAYLAALAMETGAELVSADRDFSRFPVCAGESRRLVSAHRGHGLPIVSPRKESR